MNKLLRLLLTTVFLLMPTIALAHSPIKGIGVFLNGMVHPVLVPAQLIIIISLGLWFGQNKPVKHQNAVLSFLAACTLGLIAAGLLNEKDISTVLLIVAILLSLLVVIGISTPDFVYYFLGVLSGFVLGLDSSPGELTGSAKIASLFGSGVGIYFLMLYAMALSETLSSKPWQTVLVRILASWLSASALMVLALTFSR